jgi:hypothetical protein
VASVYNQRYLGSSQWVDNDFVKSAYDYFKLANGTDDWTTWKYLNPADPARQFLQSGDAPPPRYTMPPSHYQDYLFYKIYQTPAEQRDPNEILELQSINPQYAEMLNYEQQIRATEQYYDEQTPNWLKTYMSVVSDPAWSGVTNMLPFGIIAALSGNPLMGIAMPVTGAIIGKANEWANAPGASMLQKAASSGVSVGTLAGLMSAWAGWGAIPIGLAAGGAAAAYTSITGNPVSDEILMAMDWFAEQFEGVLGTAVQIGGSIIKPEEFGTTEELLSDIHSTYEAGKTLYAAMSVPSEKALFNWINILPAAGLAWANMRGQAAEAAKIQFAEPGETFFVPGDYSPHGYSPEPFAVDATFAMISEAARKDIQRGEDPVEVVMKYNQMFGISGEIAELVGHMLLDP